MLLKISQDHFLEVYDKMLSKLTDWVDAIIINLPNIIIAILVFAIAIIGSKQISKIAERLLAKSNLQRSMKKLISQAISLVIILASIFLILGILNLGKALNALLAGAGVAGLAVGLALQGALANTYSGIVLSYIKELKFGDWIKTNDYEGEVVDIDLRVTTIKEKDNNLVYIPNKIVVDQALKNYSQTNLSRVILHCGVHYDSNMNDVEDLVRKVIHKNFDEIHNPDEIIFLWTEFADSSINFETRFFIKSKRVLEVAKAKSKAMVLIKKTFDEHSISIPFPIRTLEFPKNMLIQNQRD